MNRSFRFALPLVGRWAPRVLWFAALVAVAAPSARAALAVPFWAPQVASVITMGTLALVTLWLIGRLPSAREPWPERLLRVVPGVAILVGVAGSLTLPAMVPAAVWIAAYARHAGRRAGMLAALAAGALLGIGGVVALGNGALMPWAVATALLICSAAGDHPAVRTAQVTPGAGIARNGRSPVATEADTRALADFLEDARELLDADDVVLWRWSASAEELQLVTRASRDDRIALFPMQEGTPARAACHSRGQGGRRRWRRAIALSRRARARACCFELPMTFSATSISRDFTVRSVRGHAK